MGFFSKIEFFIHELCVFCQKPFWFHVSESKTSVKNKFKVCFKLCPLDSASKIRCKMYCNTNFQKKNFAVSGFRS